MSGWLLSAILAVLLFGWSSAQAQAPYQGGQATVTTSGVDVGIRTGAWSGDPEHFDKVVPVLVEITNDGETPLRVRHENFELQTASGPVHATPPFDLAQTETEFDDTPYGRGRGYYPFGAALYPYGSPFFQFRGSYPYGVYGPFGDPFFYDPGFQAIRRVQLPTADMVSGALPETVLDPGERAAGFVYFVDDDDVVDLDNARDVQLEVTLEDARSRERVATVVFPLLADDDALAIDPARTARVESPAPQPAR